MKLKTMYNRRYKDRYPRSVLVWFEDDNGEFYFGISKCMKGDVFKKKIGREIAMKRALKAMKVNTKHYSCSASWGTSHDPNANNAHFHGWYGKTSHEDIIFRHFRKVG